MKSSMITAPPGHKGRIRAVRAEWPKYGDKLAFCVVFCAARSPLSCFEVAVTGAVRTPRVVGALILIKVHMLLYEFFCTLQQPRRQSRKTGGCPPGTFCQRFVLPSQNRVFAYSTLISTLFGSRCPGRGACAVVSCVLSPDSFGLSTPPLMDWNDEHPPASAVSFSARGDKNTPILRAFAQMSTTLHTRAHTGRLSTSAGVEKTTVTSGFCANC